MFLHAMWLAMTYLLGAFPFGLLVAKMVCGLDPRTAGSRNTGATNVARLCGLRVGVAALVLDICKGFAPVAMAATFSCSPLFLSAVALFAILGHMHSCFLQGKGGKGVATTIGVFAALSPLSTLIAAAGHLSATALTGYVSAGSLALGALLPVCMLVFAPAYAPAALLAMLLMYWKHRGNIQRLARGKENSWRK